MKSQLKDLKDLQKETNENVAADKERLPLMKTELQQAASLLKTFQKSIPAKKLQITYVQQQIEQKTYGKAKLKTLKKSLNQYNNELRTLENEKKKHYFAMKTLLLMCNQSNSME